ncbi:uncharacterized protein BCR38DRAFT_470813 [Pseudomassariella vexata]|uniref:Uncharacterized protein n=1 Tax=Pseudomassariella vexata TaxID=1141098 RepID=A0A1Y2EKC8_9PEZI|nr:uncharacterized protein BCR38DRAFT_470813 [Pseudomassariella vexata]ORY71980.1 hypothetical protein BCR38DRAFT_470813 [Pseudomassariella vexata]
MLPIHVILNLVVIIGIALASTAVPSHFQGSSGLRHAAQASGTGPTPIFTAFNDDHMAMDSDISSRRLAKRAYFTCWETLPKPLVTEDCQKVITDIRAYQGNVSVVHGICATWYNGTCKAQFCTMNKAPKRGMNVSSQWIADHLENPLLDSCVRDGQDGALDYVERQTLAEEKHNG